MPSILVRGCRILTAMAQSQVTPAPKRVILVAAVSDADGGDQQFRTRLDRLQMELDQTRLWCTGLEQQQAQLKCFLGVLACMGGQ